MKPKKQSWIVTVRAEVTKEIYTSECTEQQARENPYNYSEDEREISQEDYTVVSVEPNE